MANPFNYGVLAQKDNFVDRIEDRRMLKSLLLAGTNVILMSPRRWGKSSLVWQSTEEILNENTGVKVCRLDVFSVQSVAQFYKLFAETLIKETSSSWRQWVSDTKEFIKSIVPKITIGSDPLNELSLSIDFRNEELNQSEILDMPERIAKKKGCSIIVCIDEFQSLAELDGFDELERRMRSVWQLHSNVTYCLLGSYRHMMSDIFNSSQKPFYRFGQVLYLKKIPKNNWVEYIVNAFENTGKMISEKNASAITDTTKNHSWYVQQYASAVWNYTDKGAEVEESTIAIALLWVIDTNVPSFQTQYKTLTSSQINLLKAIAQRETQLTSDVIMRKYELGSSALVVKNKKILLQRDFIDEYSGTIEFLDPIFEIWFKKLYSIF